MGALPYLGGILADHDVHRANRGTRLKPRADSGLPVSVEVRARGVPILLRDDEDPETEPRHDFGRLRADRRRVKPPFRMGYGARADTDFRNLEVLAAVGETLLGQSHKY